MGFKDRLQFECINNESVKLYDHGGRLEAPSPVEIMSSPLLNDECGAAYVQLGQKLPRNWDPSLHANKKCISFDGDADRQIYFYGDEESNLTIIDGDK